MPLSKFEMPEEGDEHDGSEEHGFIQNHSVNHFLSRKVPHISSGRVVTAFKVVFTMIERCLPVLGFASLISGGVVYGGLYVSRLIETQPRLC